MTATCSILLLLLTNHHFVVVPLSSSTGLKPIKLRNVATNQVTFDVLHHSSKQVSTSLFVMTITAIGPFSPEQPSICNETVCLGSLMNPVPKENKNHPMDSSQQQGRSKEQLLTEAYQFMEQYYASVKRLHTPAHRDRLREIESEVHDRGTYELRQTELIFGAKLAWRNAPRCIGRIQWSKLQVRRQANESCVRLTSLGPSHFLIISFASNIATFR